MARHRSLRTTVGVAVLAASSLCLAADDNALKLWYQQPAGAWTQALPVGNGRLAAMVFGDARKEHLQLNEDTVWSGEKRDRSNPEASKGVSRDPPSADGRASGARRRRWPTGP